MQHTIELHELINAQNYNSSVPHPELVQYYLNQEPRQRKIKDTWERQKNPDQSAFVLLTNRIRVHAHATFGAVLIKTLLQRPELFKQQLWRLHFNKSVNAIREGNYAQNRDPIKLNRKAAMVELLHFHGLHELVREE
jgi:hypothetical protein